MTTRSKLVLTYVGGIITGIILTVMLALAVGTSGNNEPMMFDQPGQKIEADEFTVIQVLPNGNALAMARGGSYLTVLFLGGNGTTYYDGQQIEVPSDKCVKQTGTYRYMSRNNIEKTVPVVEFFDRR